MWSQYKSVACFLQPHLASGLSDVLGRRGREESTGTSKPSEVETNVAQIVGSKASLADVEPRAGIALTQGLEWGPVLGQLLRETLLGQDGGGLLVLRAGRLRGGDLALLEGLVDLLQLQPGEPHVERYVFVY